MATCVVTFYLKESDDTPLAGARVRVHKVQKVGEIFEYDHSVFGVDESDPSGADGKVELALARGSIAYVSLPATVNGVDYTEKTNPHGRAVTIPDAPAALFTDIAPGEPLNYPAASQAALNAEVAARQAGDALAKVTLSADGAVEFGDAMRALVLFDTAAGDVTAALPPAAGLGREVYGKKVSDDFNLGILDGAGSETIDGVQVFNLELYRQSVRLLEGEGEWYIVV